MGHAHHFLSRLDRVSSPQVELALALYRDDELLRYVLHRARAPEGAERIAISLEDPVEGPFLIVTREGRFVTCLGKGMRAGALPVITRGQLDGITAKMEDFRARNEVRAQFDDKGGLDRLMRRIFDAGPELSREEFIAVSSLQPLLAREFFTLMASVGASVEQTRKELRPVLKRAEVLRSSWHPVLHGFWKQFWATGHFAVLAAMGGNEIFEGVAGPDGGHVGAAISMATMKDGIVVQALRGAWAVARVGKPLLSRYKQRLSSAAGLYDLFEAAIPLLALASRHGKLRAEVRKVLVPPPRYPHCPPLDRVASGLSELTKIALDTPEDLEKVQHFRGAERAVASTRHLPFGAPFSFLGIQDVPKDLAMSLATTVTGDYIHHHQEVVPLIVALPWVARADPEQLYLPQGYLKAVHRPWTPEDTLRLLSGWIEDVRQPAPPKPEGPTRNGACPCGSGKKYKRCCGA